MKLIITMLIITLSQCEKAFLQGNDLTLQDVAYSFVSFQNEVSTIKNEIKNIGNNIESNFYQAGVDHENIKKLISEKNKQIASRDCAFQFFNPLTEAACQEKKACGDKREVNKYFYPTGGCIFFCCNW